MVNESIIKEIIAFANTKGGTIIVGYNDDGTVFGIENVKKEFDKLSNMIRDSIEPDVSFLLSQKIKEEDGKDIIVIEVLQGTNKPYYLKSKGMTSQGTFVRLGATCSPTLSFLYAERVFKEKGIAFGKNEKKY
ncbi:MAG: ATP-binding protein [Clostridia bacterium]|nr:ATP-binding protein [Clostridia bacterium]